MKKVRILLLILAVLLSDAMCAVTAYSYRDMLCGIAHSGSSAPASVAFLSALPYAVGITLCLLSAHILSRRER